MTSSTFSSSQLKIIEKIGQGTFGSVYLCEDAEKDGKLCVIKSIPYHDCKHLYRSILTEFTIFNQVNHPRIVDYINFFQSKKCWNFVMEYCSGGMLKTQLKNQLAKGFFTQDELLHKFMDIATGLKYLHDKMIIHRDLKPENILVDDYGRLKIADFGISQILEDNEDFKHDNVMGTPMYSAPEIYFHSTYNKSCDIWSLGIIFYEMATLRYPFTQNELLAMLKKKGSFKTPVVDNKAKYSSGIQKLISSMIVPDPTLRITLSEIFKYSWLAKIYCELFFEEVHHAKSIRNRH